MSVSPTTIVQIIFVRFTLEHFTFPIPFFGEIIPPFSSPNFYPKFFTNPPKTAIYSLSLSLSLALSLTHQHTQTLSIWKNPWSFHSHAHWLLSLFVDLSTFAHRRLYMSAILRRRCNKVVQILKYNFYLLSISISEIYSIFHLFLIFEICPC